VSFYTETVAIGRTSMTVRVLVEAERWGESQASRGAAGRGEKVIVTQAEVVLVAINDQGQPVPIRPDVPQG